MLYHNNNLYLLITLSHIHYNTHIIHIYLFLMPYIYSSIYINTTNLIMISLIFIYLYYHIHPTLSSLSHMHSETPTQPHYTLSSYINSNHAYVISINTTYYTYSHPILSTLYPPISHSLPNIYLPTSTKTRNIVSHPIHLNPIYSYSYNHISVSSLIFIYFLISFYIYI